MCCWPRWRTCSPHGPATTGSDRPGGPRREPIIDGIDLSRTVGWFTTMFPVALTAKPHWADALKSVKEELRAIPNHGIGFGAATTAAVSFNYLGQIRSLDGDAAPDTPRAHLLDVVAGTDNDQLSFTWYYCAQSHHEETVWRLAEQLRDAVTSIVSHCAQPDAGGRTPSDFPLARLDQATVDSLAGDGRDVEDIYPLTPMQAGMVFHTIADPPRTSTRSNCGCPALADPVAFGAAWQRVVEPDPEPAHIGHLGRRGRTRPGGAPNRAPADHLRRVHRRVAAHRPGHRATDAAEHRDTAG